MMNISDKNTRFSPKEKKSSKAEVIHTINVKQDNKKLKNTVHTVKKETGDVSGKLYGLNITLYNKGRSISGEVGLIDSGSGYSLMGIDKYWELNRKSKIELEQSNAKLVSVTNDEIENLGEYAKNRYMNAVRTRDLAMRHFQESRDSMLDRQHRNSTTRDINPGNIVYLKAVK